MDRRLCVLARVGRLGAAIAGAALVTGCGSGRPGLGPPGPPGPQPVSAQIPARLLREARPIGPGPGFHPPARGPIAGPCRRRLGRRTAAHVEVFAADRVLVIPGAVGVRGPVTVSAGRIITARCFGPVVTVEPTGVVLMRPGPAPNLAMLFRAWGQPLSAHRVAGFGSGRGRPVRVYVGGRRVAGAPGAVRLRRHGEVVVEIGPFVPPHARYGFPPGF